MEYNDLPNPKFLKLSIRDKLMVKKILYCREKFKFVFLFLLHDSLYDIFKHCQLFARTEAHKLTFLNLFFVAKGRWLLSKTLYNFEQRRIWSIALILPLSADGGCDARALDDLRRARIGLPEQRKCFVASIIPLWHQDHAYALPSLYVKKRENSTADKAKFIIHVSLREQNFIRLFRKTCTLKAYYCEITQ